MNDKESLRQLYEDMYAAMVHKDRKELERIHADPFVLVHITGMRQDKGTYIRAILDGTLNYYSAETRNLEIEAVGDRARMRGESLVSAAVFGGGRHTWRLRLDLQAEKRGGQWRLTGALASVW